MKKQLIKQIGRITFNKKLEDLTGINWHHSPNLHKCFNIFCKLYSQMNNWILKWYKEIDTKDRIIDIDKIIIDLIKIDSTTTCITTKCSIINRMNSKCKECTSREYHKEYNKIFLNLSHSLKLQFQWQLCSLKIFNN